MDDGLSPHEMQCVHDAVIAFLKDHYKEYSEGRDVHHNPEMYHSGHKPLGDVAMSEGINTDKVIVNAGGQGDGAGGLGAAAMIAALGNRNEGSDNAALIAALGNRNDDSNSWGPAMMAMMGNRHPGYGYGDGFGGMNGILGIAALGLIFGRGRGGLFGGGDGDGGAAENRLQDNADTLAILSAIGGAKDATVSGFGTTALALSQGFANVKDSQQASTFLLSNQINTVNQNVSEQGCQTREVVLAAQNAILTALKDNRISELEDRVRELHGRGDARDSEVRVTQTVNQAQAQQQQQQIVNDRFARLEAILGNVIQVAHATNQNVIAGNSGPVATGAQTANPTNVNTRS